MTMDPSINYIVSGLERSGTSMLMQILYNGGYSVASDEKRKPDENNPKGYFELEGGKIINKLIENTFNFQQYKGQIIKITAYGLKFLPDGKYTIIYSERNIEEILDSMEKMAQINDENRQETKEAFIKLNSFIKQYISKRVDCNVLFVNYNHILRDPEKNITELYNFLNIDEANIKDMINTVDKDLYRNRKVK